MPNTYGPSPMEATPKPRAGEHKRWADQYDFDRSNPATRLFIAASNWVDRCEAAEAERDLLRERERELVEVLEKIASCHSAFDGDVVSIAYKALAKVRP